MADQAAQADECKARGNAALSAKNFPLAIEEYTKAIELDPSNHVFYSNRSAAYLSSKQADKALEDADACIKANPTWAKGFSRRGAALHELGRVDEAVAAYDEGLAIEPTNAGLREGRQSAMRAMAQNPFADLVSWCAIHPKFRDYMSDPTFVNSIRMLSTNPSALSAVGSDARIMEVIAQRLGLDLGGAAGGDDDSSAAAPAADHSAASSGPATEGSAAEASAAGAEEPEPEYSEEEKADMERERAEAEAAAKIRAEADAAKARGNAHYKKREFEEAIACYEEAIAMLPDELTYRLNKSAALFEAGRDAECVALCEEVVESGRAQKPIPFVQISKAIARLGSIELRAGNLVEAVEQFERAQSESHSPVVERKIKALKKQIVEAAELAYRDPTKAAEAKELGNTEFKACNFLAAIEHYSEAVKRDPENAIYWTNRATARCKVLDFGGAMSDVQTAIKLNPDYAKAYGRKARIEMLSKQYHHALDTVSEGLHRDSANVELQEVMAELQVKINEAMFSAPDPVRQERAMQDPEIQAIMRDPMVQQALRDLSTDPSAMSKISSDPGMSRKLNRLILAGVVSFGSPAAGSAAAEED